MCGIAGIVNLRTGDAPPPADLLGSMIGTLRHRGPDEFGAYQDPRAALGHARLSIIDLSTGQQPLCNETGTLWIVFNGEVYNYVELRRELVALGHSFRTESDTEVLLHAYESWGLAAFEKFNGQWALAIWDCVRKQLTLARDRLGVRPLHWCCHDGRLYFASEVKAIFAADSTIPRALDPIGLAQTFTFWTSVAPQGVFRGVQELEPGHVRVYQDDRQTDVTIWSPAYPVDGRDGFPGTVEEASEAVRSALEQATNLRMLRADVPVGSYLSGGLDSSVIAALALKAKGQQFQTFSLRFEDAEYDETPYQRLMARHLGSEHHEVLVSSRDIGECFPDVVYHAERPVLRTAAAPLFLLSKLVHDAGIKVVLTGEGADEMFAGYDLFREGKIRRFWARQPSSAWRATLLTRLYPYLARSPVQQQAMARQFFGRGLADWRAPGFAHGTRWQTTKSLFRLFSEDVRTSLQGRDVTTELLATLPGEFGSWPFLAQDQYLEIRTLLSGYLLSSQGDRMLMAHSVEGRFPFLDPNVVELSNMLPAVYKLRGLDEKHVLKRASGALVPPEILTRPKQPYRAPDAASFVGPNAPDWVADAMSEGALRDVGVFDARAASRLYRQCVDRAGQAPFSNTDNMALVGVLSTQLLHQHFIRDFSSTRIPAVPIRFISSQDRRD